VSELFSATSMPDREWWAALWPDPAAVLRQLGITSGMTVLDLCCGDGYFTAPLAKLVDGKVYALDLDPMMIDRAKAEVASHGASVRRWVCADAREVAAHIPEPLDYVLMSAPSGCRPPSPRGHEATARYKDEPRSDRYGEPRHVRPDHAEWHQRKRLMSRSITQPNFQQRSRAFATASSADRPGR